MLLSFCKGILIWPLFCCAVLISVLSSFAEERVSCFKTLTSCCHITVRVLCLFLTVLLLGLQCEILAFTGHTNLPFLNITNVRKCYFCGCIVLWFAWFVSFSGFSISMHTQHSVYMRMLQKVFTPSLNTQYCYYMTVFIHGFFWLSTVASWTAESIVIRLSFHLFI